VTGPTTTVNGPKGTGPTTAGGAGGGRLASRDGSVSADDSPAGTGASRRPHLSRRRHHRRGHRPAHVTPHAPPPPAAAHPPIAARRPTSARPHAHRAATAASRPRPLGGAHLAKRTRAPAPLVFRPQPSPQRDLFAERRPGSATMVATLERALAAPSLSPHAKASLRRLRSRLNPDSAR